MVESEAPLLEASSEPAGLLEVGIIVGFVQTFRRKHGDGGIRRLETLNDQSVELQAEART